MQAVADMPWRDDGAKEATKATSDAFLAIDRRQLIGRLDAVEQRDRDGVSPHQRAHRFDGLRSLPALHRQQHEIHRADCRGIIRRLGGLDEHIAIHTLDAQPILAQSA